MHCELVIPGLFAAPPATRLPALELLLARGHCTSEASQRLETWLAAAPMILGSRAVAIFSQSNVISA